ncbi:YdbL family protein [Pantoea sp. FN060301]|uniref:YdbL family protein n=1 Tax=Pantoea sp. FN060301 TaxID=3420380 RepID=UPI003D179C32
MNRLKRLIIAAILLSPSALALTLDEGRQQGRVGETLSGYIAPRAEDKETQALVEKINQGRRAEYQRIARENRLTTDGVASIAGQKLVERALPGEYVRGINGRWFKKGE